MSLPLSILDRRLQTAQEDLPEVEDYLRRRGRLLQLAIAKDPEQRPIHHHFVQHFKGREWHCVLNVGATAMEHSAVLYWLRCPHGKARWETLEGIQPRKDGRSLYFDTHFFGRWGLRTENLRVKFTNMQGFLRKYPRLRMLDTGLFKHGRRAVAAAIDEGLVHGALLGNKMISCDTFIDFSRMHPDEHRLWKRLRSITHARIEAPADLRGAA
jgi:hypothetical protein